MIYIPITDELIQARDNLVLAKERLNLAAKVLAESSVQERPEHLSSYQVAFHNRQKCQLIYDNLRGIIKP